MNYIQLTQIRYKYYVRASNDYNTPLEDTLPKWVDMLVELYEKEGVNVPEFYQNLSQGYMPSRKYMLRMEYDLVCKRMNIAQRTPKLLGVEFKGRLRYNDELR